MLPPDVFSVYTYWDVYCNRFIQSNKPPGAVIYPWPLAAHCLKIKKTSENHWVQHHPPPLTPPQSSVVVF